MATTKGRPGRKEIGVQSRLASMRSPRQSARGKADQLPVSEETGETNAPSLDGQVQGGVRQPARSAKVAGEALPATAATARTAGAQQDGNAVVVGAPAGAAALGVGLGRGDRGGLRFLHRCRVLAHACALPCQPQRPGRGRARRTADEVGRIRVGGRRARRASRVAVSPDQQSRRVGLRERAHTQMLLRPGEPATRQTRARRLPRPKPTHKYLRPRGRSPARGRRRRRS